MATRQDSRPACDTTGDDGQRAGADWRMVGESERGELTVKVGEVMTRHVLTTTPGCSLREAARKMVDNNVGAMVIVDPEQPGPGIVTERDLVRSLGRGENPDDETVAEHLTADATFADVEWDLEQAADAMAAGGFRHLVVIEGGELVGIISMRDLIQTWRPSARGAHR
jgi:CBS domain-containing protein